MNIGGDWKVEIVRNILNQCYEVTIYRSHPEGIEYVVMDSKDKFSGTKIYKNPKTGEKWEAPYSFLLPYEAPQGFMDALWSMGIRPSERRYENELDLLKNHLKDIRFLLKLPAEKS